MKHGLHALVLRQFELYGKLIEIPTQLQQAEREHYIQLRVLT